eukprot:jgi/Bigna1/133703/aug1.22_g8411
MFEQQARKNPPEALEQGQVSIDNVIIASDVLAYKAKVSSRFEAEWILPKDEQIIESVVIYAHGGGFVAGSHHISRSIACEIALKSKCTAVLNVNYRLAPEYPFPAAPKDIFESLRYVVKRLGVEKERVVMMGDSAGASLCVSTLLKVKKRAASCNEDLMPGGCALLSPVFSLLPYSLEVFGLLYGLHPAGSSENESNDGDYEAKELNYVMGWERPDLSGFPPTLIQAGGGEVLRDDAKDFAEHAINCEVQCQLEIYEGMFHAFQLFPRFVDAGKDAVVSICTFVEATARQQESKKATANIYSAIVKDSVRVGSN